MGRNNCDDERRREEERAAWPTPASNTGVTVAWAGIHWFAGTVKHIPADAVAAEVARAFGVAPVLLPRGGMGYSASYRVGPGRVYWSPGRADVFVSLPGEACEWLSLPDLVALAVDLQLEPNSRLDVAWDCDGVTPGTFARAFRAGDVVTRIHRDIDPETGRMKGIELRSNWEGDTVYLGSRQSERFIRVYDRRGPTRLEMEWKGSRAIALWRRLVAVTESEASREAMAELRAFIDFRDRSAAGRPDCCPLLEWWAELVGDAGRSCVCIPRAARTLEQVEDWVFSQVAPSLAMLHDAHQQDWTRLIKRFVSEGRERYVKHPDKLGMVLDVSGVARSGSFPRT